VTEAQACKHFVQSCNTTASWLESNPDLLITSWTPNHLHHYIRVLTTQQYMNSCTNNTQTD